MSYASTIRDLRAKSKQLEAKKRDIDKQVEAIYTTLRVFVGNVDNDGSVVTKDASPYAQELTDAMCDILASERPLHRQDILARVQERGIHVGGQKPVGTIGSYLSMGSHFRNAGRGIWTLAEEPQSEQPDESPNGAYED